MQIKFCRVYLRVILIKILTSIKPWPKLDFCKKLAAKGSAFILSYFSDIAMYFLNSVCFSACFIKKSATSAL
ncbi:MAG: hypothetical protein WCH78_05070, partial [Bacteroidota bacterium]